MQQTHHVVSLLLDPTLSIFDIAERAGLDITQLADTIRSHDAEDILSDLRAIADYRVALTVAQSLPDAAQVLAKLAARARNPRAGRIVPQNRRTAPPHGRTQRPRPTQRPRHRSRQQPRPRPQ